MVRLESSWRAHCSLVDRPVLVGSLEPVVDFRVRRIPTLPEVGGSILRERVQTVSRVILYTLAILVAVAVSVTGHSTAELGLRGLDSLLLHDLDILETHQHAFVLFLVRRYVLTGHTIGVLWRTEELMRVVDHGDFLRAHAVNLVFLHYNI